MKRLFLSHTPIVLYHFVGATPLKNGRLRGPALEHFENHIKLLKKYFDFVSLSEILSYNRNSTLCEAPPLVFTFDDGFDIVGSGAMEVLRAYNIKATLFVITSCLDNKSLMWRNKLQAICGTKDATVCIRNYNEVVMKFGLPQISSPTDIMLSSKQWPYHLKDLLADEFWNSCDMPPLQEYLETNRPYLNESDLDALVQEGHEVGLHTHTHPFCSQLDDEDVRFEIVAPAFYLTKRFRLKTVSFAYPFGDRLDHRIEKRLCDAGTISSAVGYRGFQKLAFPEIRLERAGCDKGVSFPVFGKSLARMVFSIPTLRGRFPKEALGQDF
jgi:peptidoglycan/xylan/chitin deacetylase (PgdA/CDA1 family)